MIIGIDIGTTTGWAVRAYDGMLDSGFWKFASNPSRYQSFAAKLADSIQQYGAEAVAYEHVLGHKGTQAAHVFGGFQAFLQTTCRTAGVEDIPVPVRSIKQYATGSGRASKADMIKAANNRWPDVNVTDDNQADAMWIAEYAFDLWK